MRNLSAIRSSFVVILKTTLGLAEISVVAYVLLLVGSFLTEGWEGMRKVVPTSLGGTYPV